MKMEMNSIWNSRGKKGERNNRNWHTFSKTKVYSGQRQLEEKEHELGTWVKLLVCLTGKL